MKKGERRRREFESLLCSLALELLRRAAQSLMWEVQWTPLNGTAVNGTSRLMGPLFEEHLDFLTK